MSHPGGGGGGTGPGGGGGTGPGRDVLRAIDDGIAGLIDVARRRLPAATSDAEEIGQAALILRLKSAREAVAEMLQTPARRDPSEAAVGADAIATTGGPVYIRTPGLPADVIARDWAGLR